MDVAGHRRRISPLQQRWPSRLWIVCHGQSAGNVAADAAHGAGLAASTSPSGTSTSRLARAGCNRPTPSDAGSPTMPVGERPKTVLTSPYLRAKQTSERIRAAGGLTEAVGPDRRRTPAREGAWHPGRLTQSGVEQLHPEQAEMRRRLGQVLLPYALQRELVRRNPAPPKRPRHGLAAPWRKAGAHRRASSRVLCPPAVEGLEPSGDSAGSRPPPTGRPRRLTTSRSKAMNACGTPSRPRIGGRRSRTGTPPRFPVVPQATQEASLGPQEPRHVPRGLAVRVRPLQDARRATDDTSAGA